ncbi:MAG: PD-(D/E)XK nuclease family protein [Acidimicrobiia bacterium]
MPRKPLLTDAIALISREIPPQKPHISHSQLSMYWRCPEQYRRRYMEGERIPPGIAMMTGSAVHKGIETNFRRKIETHEDLPAAEIKDAAVAAFSDGLADEYALTEEEETIGRGIVVGDAIDQVTALAGLHATDQAPEYQPTEVEHATRIVFQDAPVDLLAITDLRDDRHRVTDFKTAARRKPEGEVHSSVQLTIYAAAFWVDHGTPPMAVHLDTLVKTKTPKRQLLTSTRDMSHIEVLVRRINVTLAAIQAGAFTPCPPDAWQCSDRWCGYFRTCPYVNSEPQRKETDA